MASEVFGAFQVVSVVFSGVAIPDVCSLEPSSPAGCENRVGFGRGGGGWGGDKPEGGWGKGRGKGWGKGKGEDA